MDLGDLIKSTGNEPINRCVVRVSTSHWNDKSGVHYKKSITYQKRKSIGFNFLKEEVGAVGAETITNIINFFECADGLYEVVTCNESRDYESGHIDGYDLQLIPYEPDTQPSTASNSNKQ